MNPEVKRQWVAALRSGRYGQTYSMLYSDAPERPGYCCLGVLSDLFRETGRGDWECDEGSGWGFISKETGEKSYGNLVEPVVEWSGVPESRQQILVEMNDSYESFIAIADYIEERL